MSKITGNEPINPTIWDDRNVPYFLRDHDGLTVRQYYAGLAMQGLLAMGFTEGDEVIIAKVSVSLSDALITELNKLP